MAVFGFIENETIVQTNDKTRIDSRKSFTSDSHSITNTYIKPETSADFIDVHQTGYLDWQYATAGEKTITLKLTLNNTDYLFTKTLLVLTPEQDKLFSNDQELVQYENDILKWLPDGRNSFLNIHRQAQYEILDWLDSIRVWKDDGSRLEKQDILITTDVKQLSIFLTLSMIFATLSNQVGDIFEMKSKNYYNKAQGAKNRGRIQADFNNNQVLDKTDSQDLRSFRLVRSWV